jgi:SpoVK/Ycf46/Vps4 family AAA+-type ATPase
MAASLRATGKHKPLLLTGKSAAAAANAIAKEFGGGIYRVDLAAVVSKYVGETEKNLERVFREAEKSSVLLFDEADALFGKRTEVKDAHDRYSNLAIGYLLQQAEARRGLIVLVSQSQRALPIPLRRRFSIHLFPPLGVRTA